MKCPVCKDIMLIIELNEVEVDYCSSCSGVWLDAGELELLIDEDSDAENLLSSFHIDEDHTEKPYKCPICNKRMSKVHVGENRDVIIDKCPAGDGLWFDEGELKDVIYLASEENRVIHLLNDLFGNKINNNQNGES
jgi:Zn-finger nucleic acid-binding protein